MSVARWAGFCAVGLGALGGVGFALVLTHAQPAPILTIVPEGNGFQLAEERANDGTDVVLIESIPTSTSAGAILDRWDWNPESNSVSVEASTQDIVDPERCDLVVVIDGSQAASSPGGLESSDTGWTCRAAYTGSLLSEEGAQIGVQFVAGASTVTSPLISPRE